MSTRRFFALILAQMLASALSYTFEVRYLATSQYYHVFRALRMTLIYVFPTLYFMRREKDVLEKLGIRHIPERKILAYTGGIAIYVITALIFIKHRIFFGGWEEVSLSQYLLIITLTGLMASITDFWTRGFILLKVARTWGEVKAIALQNLVWLLIHLYEIQLLEPYIGLWYAVFLTLFLGISGDLITLRSGNIIGLMAGHVILNIMVSSVASGMVSENLFSFLRSFPL